MDKRRQRFRASAKIFHADHIIPPSEISADLRPGRSASIPVIDDARLLRGETLPTRAPSCSANSSVTLSTAPLASGGRSLRIVSASAQYFNAIAPERSAQGNRKIDPEKKLCFGKNSIILGRALTASAAALRERSRSSISNASNCEAFPYVAPAVRRATGRHLPQGTPRGAW